MNSEKFEMITKKDMKILQELKKFCSKHRVTIGPGFNGEKIIIKFRRSTSDAWYYLNTCGGNKVWTLSKSFDQNVVNK